MIKLTEKASSKLKGLGATDGFLKITVISGGCAGMKYDASVVNEKEESDIIVDTVDGIDIVSDAKSSLFIDGLEVDYSDDLIQAGFQLINKGAAGACGCGASFTV
jgi:iron-sulfur cluster assembly accessory protein